MVDLLQYKLAVIDRITLIIGGKCILDFWTVFELSNGLLKSFCGYISI